jgi:hypothetical protein
MGPAAVAVFSIPRWDVTPLWISPLWRGGGDDDGKPPETPGHSNFAHHQPFSQNNANSGTVPMNGGSAAPIAGSTTSK